MLATRLVLVTLLLLSGAAVLAQTPEPAPLSAEDWGTDSSEEAGETPPVVEAAPSDPVDEGDDEADTGEALTDDPAAPDGSSRDAPSVGEQVDPERSALPPVDDKTQLRLRLDTIELERLYEAVRQESARETLRLGVEECVHLALDRNQDILIVGYTPLKADADILSARGEFDPVLSSNATYFRAEQQTSPETQTFGGLGSVEVFRTSSTSSLGGKLHWGTTYNVQFDLSKEETTYNRFIEEWSGGLTLSLSQPLLRGRGRPANLAFIRSAKKARLQADDQVHIQTMATVAEVVKAYWDLVGTVEAVKVRRESLDNAERLLAINERRYEIGTGAALEVVQAKAGVATRQSDLISARSQALDAGDALKNLLSMRDEDMLSPVRVVPIDTPSLREVELSEEESVARAMTTRPEIRSAELAIESVELELKRAANDLLPQVDVTGSVSRGGRGHYLSDVFDGIRDKTDRSYSVGVQGSVPIGNRAARGAHQRARLDKREAGQRLLKTQQDLMLNVRFAVRNAATSRILVESNKQARALQETNVAAEEKRLRLGVTTSFEVLRVQEDLTAAQVQELQSIIAYEKALVDLHLSEGTLLTELGIIYEPVERERPVSYLRSVFPPSPK